MTATTIATGGPGDASPTFAKKENHPLGKLFDHGQVIDSRRRQSRDGLREIRTSLVKVADFKYPMVRFEETAVRSQTADDFVVTDRRASVADHVIVKLRDTAALASLKQAIEPMGFSIRRALRGANLFLVQAPNASLDTLKELNARMAEHRDLIEYSEPDDIVYALDTLPNDPVFGQLWGMHNTGQTGGKVDADIDAPAAWDVSKGSASIVVGVIDTGIDLTHRDLAANLWTNTDEVPGDGIDNDANGFVDDVHGYDFVNNDGNPTDDHNHGTHCSGTIGGAGGDGIGIVGVNWKVSLMGLKFLSAGGSGAISDAVEAVLYSTANGANLTSNSWGGGGFSQALKDAIDAAGTANKLFVAAAGNSAYDMDSTNSYPAGYDSDNIIAVAATDHKDELAYFSNYGKTRVDLGAPGVAIYSSVKGGDYASYSGTSMACPHVAGAAALLLSIGPALPPSQIKRYLLESAEPIPALENKTVSGGRLNVGEAIRLVNGPYLAPDSITVDDSAGNADGIINPGEIVRLVINLRNLGIDAATGAVATLAFAGAQDPSITLQTASESLGTLAPNVSATSRTLAFLVGASVAVPHDIQLVLALTDAGAHRWEYPVSLKVFRSFKVRGTVLDDATSGPVASASVTYAGPQSGTATVDASGTYEFLAVNGNYTVTAEAPGFLPEPAALAVRSDAEQPAGSGVIVQNFRIGKATASLDTAPLEITLAEGTTTTRSITVTNSGNRPLTFEVAGFGTPWIPEPGTLWHETNLRATKGATSYYYGIEEKRSYDTGDTNKGALVAGPLLLPASLPSLAFDEWLEKDPFVGYDNASVQISSDGGGTWTEVSKSSDTAGKWQPHAPIDLSAYAGKVVRLRLLFDTVNRWFNNYEGWYADNFSINGLPLGWLAATTSSALLPPQGTASITVTADATELPPGTYQHRIAVQSNDPRSPQTSIDVKVNVLAGPRPSLAGKLVNDRAGGDGDRKIEPGETGMELSLYIENLGQAALPAGVSATLSTTDLYVSVASALSSYPGIPASGTASNATPFKISVDRKSPIGHLAVLKLLLSDGKGFEKTIEFTVEVGSQINNAPRVTLGGPSVATARTDAAYAAVAGDIDGDTLRYIWDFGDGNGIIGYPTETVRFPTAGNYTVSVGVSDYNGGNSTASASVTVSDPLLAWTQFDTAQGFSTGIYHRGLWIASGSYASSLMVSPNGSDWRSVSMPYSYSRIFSRSESTIVMAAYTYNSTTQKYEGLICHSRDGQTWEKCSHPAFTQIQSIACGNGRFLASTSDKKLLTSPDGVSWQELATDLADESLTKIEFGVSAFVGRSSKGGLVRSVDGAAWSRLGTARGLPASGYFYGLAYEPLNRTFVALTSSKAYASADDGLTWESAALPASYYSIQNCVAGYGLIAAIASRYFYDTSTTKNYLLVSEDGLFWGASELTDGGDDGLIIGNGRLLRFKASGSPASMFLSASAFPSNRAPAATITVPTPVPVRESVLLRSNVSDPEGDSCHAIWDLGTGPLMLADSEYLAHTSLTGGNFTATVHVTDEHGNVSTARQAFTVTDAFDTWQKAANPSTAALNSICSNGAVLVAVGDAGTILRSSDGLAWTSVGASGDTGKYLRSVCWTGTHFIAAGYQYYFQAPSWIYGGILLSSPDGQTWTERLRGGEELRAVATDGKLVVAVGDGGRIVTCSTTTGEAWAECASGTTEQFNRVAAGNGRFVASSWSGLRASDNVLAWSAVTRSASAPYFYSADISFADGQFVVPYGSTIYRSANLVEWTNSSLPDSPSISSFASGNGFLFATVNRSVNSILQYGYCTSYAGGTWTPMISRPSGTRSASCFHADRFYAVGAGGLIERSGPLTKPVGYDFWTGEHFPAGGPSSLAAADADGDTFSNGVEYAMGSNPLLASSRPGISGTMTGGKLRISVPRSAVRSDVVYGVERSFDLKSWSSAGVVLTRQTASILEAEAPVDGHRQQFLRLSILRPGAK